MEKKSLHYLVMELSKENEAAFNELYRRYHKLVYYIAFQLMKNSADADDVLQETFLQVKKSVESLRDPNQFKAWIGRITYSKSMKQFQKHRDTNLSDKQIQMLSNKTESRGEFLPDHAMRHESDMQALDQCIANLKGIYREVLLLYYFAQLNIREIASVLDIPEGTVKSRLLYGKKYLRSEIDVYQERTGEQITFKATTIEALLISAGASLYSTPFANTLFPLKHSGIPPTTMLAVVKIVAITTLASSAFFGGMNIYEQFKDRQSPQELTIDDKETHTPFPRLTYKEKEVATAREAYIKLMDWAHCEVEMASKTEEEFMQVYLIYQALEAYGGTYQELLHRNNWAEQYLKFSEKYL